MKPNQIFITTVLVILLVAVVILWRIDDIERIFVSKDGVEAQFNKKETNDDVFKGEGNNSSMDAENNNLENSQVLRKRETPRLENTKGGVVYDTLTIIHDSRIKANQVFIDDVESPILNQTPTLVRVQVEHQSQSRKIKVVSSSFVCTYNSYISEGKTISVNLSDCKSI